MMKSPLAEVPPDGPDSLPAEATQPRNEGISRGADKSVLESVQTRQSQTSEGTTLEISSLQRDWHTGFTAGAQIAGKQDIEIEDLGDEVQDNVQQGEGERESEEVHGNEEEFVIGNTAIRNKEFKWIDDPNQDKVGQAQGEEAGKENTDDRANKSMRQQYQSVSGGENEGNSPFPNLCLGTEDEADMISRWKTVTGPGEPIIPSDYMWRDVSTATDAHPRLNTGPGSRCYRRPLVGAETSWAGQPAEARQMFISCSLRHEVSISRDTWNSAMLDAWIALLIEVPELMAHVVNFQAPGGYLLYAPAASDPKQIMEWVMSDAENSMATEFHNVRPGDMRLREVVLSRVKLQDRSSNMFLYSWGTWRPGCDDSILTTDIILFLDHVITDGIGARIILGKLLSHLATYIDQYPSKPLAKNAERPWRNLSSPWVCIMDEDQKTSATDHEDKAKCYVKIITQDIPLNPGFAVLQQEAPEDNQKTFYTCFTVAESRGLLGAVKLKLGTMATITHLGHAAMIIAMLRNAIFLNPERFSQASNGFVSPCWLNGRRYLRKDNNPEATFTQNCLTFSPVIFPDYQNLVLKKNSSDDWVTNRLTLACEHASRSYLALRYDEIFKSPLPGSIKMFEHLAFPMLEICKPQSETDLSAKHPQRLRPIPGSAEGVDREVPSTKRIVADPYFLSDGIMENYINHHYPVIKSQNSNAEGSQTTTRHSIIEVEALTFHAHAGQNIVVRMSTWRGQISLTAEYRCDKYEAEVVHGFIMDMKHALLLFSHKHIDDQETMYCNSLGPTLVHPRAHISPEEHILPHVIERKLSEPSTTPRLMTALVLNNVGMVSAQQIAGLLANLLEDPKYVHSRIVPSVAGRSNDATPSRIPLGYENSSQISSDEGVGVEGNLHPTGPTTSSHENTSQNIYEEGHGVGENLHDHRPSLSQPSSKDPVGFEPPAIPPASPRPKHAALPDLPFHPHSTNNPSSAPSGSKVRREFEPEEAGARRKPLLTALKSRGSSPLANELVLEHIDGLTPIVCSQNERLHDANIERVSSRLALTLAMFQQRKEHNIGASQEDISRDLAFGLQLWMDRLDDKIPQGYCVVSLLDEMNHFSDLCDELPWNDKIWKENLPRFHLLYQVFESFGDTKQETREEEGSKRVPRTMQDEEELEQTDDSSFHQAMHDSLKRSAANSSNDAQPESYGRNERVAKKRKLGKQ